MEQNWYVLRVQTGREEQVKNALEKLRESKNWSEVISNVFIPAEKVTQIKAGKRQVVQKKLFPGYVFILMQISEEAWYTIREMPGISGFLGLKDPTPMQSHEIERLLHIAEQSDEKPKVRVSFQKGDMVRVKEPGPFENFEGLVEEINERKGLVKVSMVIFGRSTSVELEYWQLEKV